MKTRLYAVKNKATGEVVAVVDAGMRGSALSHYAKKTLEAQPLSAKEYAALAGKFTIETAGGDEPEAKD